MDQPTQEELNELANKWLKGTLTPLEQEKLDQWYNLDSDEPIIWNSTNETAEELGERLLQNINSRKKVLVLPKRNWRLPAVAAILAVSIGLSFYYFGSKETTAPKVIAQTEITSGKNQAVLILANGKRIDLSAAANGNIAAQEGVSISKTEDGQLVYNANETKATDNALPQYNTIEAPAGGQWQVKLPDGSLVFLNAQSSLTYPTRFAGKERKVKLSGEAYFEVAHNKAMPFKVETPGQTVAVLGTHFNLMAYANEPFSKTTLVEGAVRLHSLQKNKSEILKPGDQGLIDKSGSLSVTAVNTDMAIAWKNGKFAFDDEHIAVIMRNLARWYNVEIVYEGNVQDKTFTMSISRYDKISKILDKISSTQAVHFKIEGRRITVMP